MIAAASERAAGLPLPDEWRYKLQALRSDCLALLWELCSRTTRSAPRELAGRNGAAAADAASPLLTLVVSDGRQDREAAERDSPPLLLVAHCCEVLLQESLSVLRTEGCEAHDPDLGCASLRCLAVHPHAPHSPPFCRLLPCHTARWIRSPCLQAAMRWP